MSNTKLISYYLFRIGISQKEECYSKKYYFIISFYIFNKIFNILDN